jgi:hypothetical protein
LELDAREKMIKTKDSRSVLLHRRNWLCGIPAILVLLLFAPSTEARTPRDSVGVTRASTQSGYPYMNGGINLDEQRAMEQIAGQYNLKLVFARSTGTLTSPAFVLIATNETRKLEKISLRGPWVLYSPAPRRLYDLGPLRSPGRLGPKRLPEEVGRKTYLIRGE